MYYYILENIRIMNRMLIWKNCLALFLCFAGGMTIFAQKEYKKAYTLFDANGKEIAYQELINGLTQPDVVFIGEIHNCCITHWLEYEISRSLYNIHKDKLMMGAEMFESDNQLILDEYMNKVITYDRFEDEARLWPNYSTDYAPFVFFAKENHIPFIATNVPRRYANVVKNRGLEYLDSLSVEAKQYLPPLPVNFTYKEEDDGTFALMQMMGKSKGNPKLLAQAQAIKDATMGWFIARNIKHKFLHFNGNYHSDFKDGIIPYLLQYRPGTTVKTVCAVRQENIDQLDDENKGRADYYICVPEDMTSTY